MKKIFHIAVILLSALYAGLIHPIHQDSLYSIHSLFEWEQEPDAASYNLQISVLENFEDIILDINTIDLMHIEENNLEWANDYYWRVRPIYQDGELGDWIDAFSFHTGFAKSNAEDVVSEVLDAEQIQDGITLYADVDKDFSLAYDLYGRQIWNDGYLDMNMVYVDSKGVI